jgi:hypothetical protein
MKIKQGVGIRIQSCFADGTVCPYKRPFLIIEFDSTNGKIKMLNVSSVLGKERKLLFKSNRLIKKYKPPFVDPSFVKLDELYEVQYFSNLEKSIVHNAEVLDNVEMADILDEFHLYSKSNQIKIVASTHQDIIKINGFLA